MHPQSEMCAVISSIPNGAEEFFSRTRRAEIGHHHHIAGAYLVRYAQEAPWREVPRRAANAGHRSRASWG